MNFEIGDVIEVTIKLEADIPDEDWDKGVIDMDKYDKKYSVDYSCQRTGSSCSDDFTVEAGFTIDDEIDCYIKEDLPKIYPEIADYEIFDINKDDFEYQSAKVKIKALKE